MGLSASQAKLLSITSRLSSIELRAQQVTRQKTALANQNIEANERYIKALNNKGLTYLCYDEDGSQVYTELTGAKLSTYAPLKNQYGLINSDGQILVSELDGKNYQESKDINEFLQKYGIEGIPTGEYQSVPNPAYPAALEKYRKEIEEWKTKEPQETDSKYWYESVSGSEDRELYDQFIDAVSKCACWSGENRKTSFYHIEHIMSKMLDYDTDFVAYPGTEKEVTYHKIPGGPGFGGNQGGSLSQGNTWTAESEAIMVEVRDKIKNNTLDPDLWQDCVNLYYETVKTSGVYYLGKINSKDNGAPALSESEIENMFYDADENNDNKSIVERLKFMLSSKLEFNQDEFDADHKEWQDKLDDITIDEAPTILQEIFAYNDNNKAQWYINLWHRMNGQSDKKDGKVENAIGEDTSTKTIGRRWDILEDGLMNSAKWLQRALENGTLTLERVNFADPTEDGTGLVKAEWKSVIYTSALEISETSRDDIKAKAEAEFNEAQKLLTAKDKQFDSILKLLDTEHSALESEYNSTKNVIEKNINSTLKLYSA